ncbi:uncharacterized protein TRAVEDRAFT_173422 [Trametes versicolor FP-101664 SS1]|uniref:uncharacterized protein n=1 Tax=Trametes versicolor (strain FP-101664) TaxID=717944 RepID=UPI0004622C49|nr:uncharacterized protein TRAVEDRAFT_173422 [Trametes versicolor FP-101664 SS1]EIW54119.1 hypothetical protein TRAVEDRAFT_173422 [Trametes versicolor FP-101664 SS1]
MSQQRQLPGYVYLTPEAAERQAERTRQGLYNLLPDEILWQTRQKYLEDHGYLLRPRYRLGWKPSWSGTDIAPDFCEDSIVSSRPQVIDATTLGDNVLVAIKTVPNHTEELAITQFLSSFKGRDENHCVAVLEILSDPLEIQGSLMVLLYLRPYNDPEFTTVGDVMDFIHQTLEGLVFMHHHRLTPLSRAEHPVRYYYVDFGLSVRFPAGSPSLVVGDVGRDAEVPELSSTVPYDAFKADIYALGNLYDKEFEQRYRSLETLRPLIDSMKQRQPELRRPPKELLSLFKQIRGALSKNAPGWRLASKSESAHERLLNDTVAVALGGISNLRRYVG